MECVFCKIAAGELPSTKVYEDERVLAFMDINPLNDGHLLVVPKRHASTLWDLEVEEAEAVARAAKRIADAIRVALQPDGLTVNQANGRAAHQVVPHYHVHLIPRWSGDGKGFDWELVPGDMQRIREVGEKIRRAING
ncbi:MAG: HIT family protein [Armatimonadota bacterium]|nr:HIT family protein [Armatimonadota bacterium]MDR5696988.1 HIT family protein [Armatimonadota bacterium]